MSDELENVEYEDDEGTATPVEILPPVVQKRRRDWKDFVLWGLAAVIAWHVIDRLADRINPAPAQASVVPEWRVKPNPPVSQERPKFNMDRAIGESERPPAHASDQVLRDWGPPACPPRYHHERGDPTWSCWPN